MEDPRAPETVEGLWLLHQMLSVRWGAGHAADRAARRTCAEQTAAALAESAPSTVLAAGLGHKADLLVVHFRRSWDELLAAQQAWARLPLAPWLEVRHSFVSVVEQSLHDLTLLLHRQGADADAREAALAEQRERLAPRLHPAPPRRRYLGFYPMSRRRGESRNWYALPLAERARLMQEHGRTGRTFAGRVTQIISGAVGVDDWEWGVDLFADDPVVFKKLLYQMRFDQASVFHAEFGPFWVGLQFSAAQLPVLLANEVPKLGSEP